MDDVKGPMITYPDSANLATSPEAEAFYAEALRHLRASGVPFLLAGTYAVSCYTGINRPTKDIDVFCKAGDFPRILAYFKELGFETEVEDERWIGKVRKGKLFFDVIFNSTTAVTPITDAWFADARPATVLGTEVLLTAPTELVWSKAFVQNRERYDGADVMHVILKQGDHIDWKRLLDYMDQYWEVLLVHVLNFRFIYPTERDRVPPWLFAELIERLQARNALPPPQMKVCRGRLYSRTDYAVDVTEWGFGDVVGMGDLKYERNDGH